MHIPQLRNGFSRQARALALATELGVVLASGFPSLQVSSLLEMPVWEELPVE